MVTLIADLALLVFSFLVCTLLFPLPKLEFDWAFSKATLMEALPFGISGVFMTIYYSVDSIILQSMQGDTVLGWYSASSRLIRYLAILPQIISVTIFPAMARFHLSSQDSLMLISEKYLKYMLVLGIPMGVGTTILADKIIYTFAGPGFTESIPAMQILIWSMVFVFAGASLTRLFESANKQRLVTRITGIGMALNVALNLVLIPIFSLIGSSIAVVLTELTMLSLLVFSVYRLGYELPARKLLGVILKVLASSAVMGLVIWYLHDLNLFVIVALGILIYAVLVVVLKVIDEEDLDLMRSMIKKGSD
jgi:O-antigen/teichoic acid export membrane protein